VTTGELTHGAPALAPAGAPPTAHREARPGRVRRARAWLRSERGRTCGTFALLALVLAAITPAESAYDGPLRLARELVAGRPYLESFIPWIEMFRHDGRAYLAYPPMVSFVLVPYAWLTRGALGQPPFNSLLIFGAALLLHRLVKSLDGMAHLARVAVVAYVLGTPLLYSAHAGNTWLLMHSEGNFFFLLALVLAMVWGRWFWAGVAFMTAVQVRYVLLLGAVVFGLLLLSRALERRSVRTAVRSGLWFTLGALPPLVGALAFQWWTLGDALLSPYRAGWTQWGLRGPQFALHYVWSNWPVYTYLYPTPIPTFPFLRFDPAGQSIFVMSPFFLGVFLLDWRRRFVRLFLPGAVLMQAFYLVYFGSGFAQYGARYATDFYPLLLPVALSAFARPGRGWRTALRLLVGLAIVANAYGVLVMKMAGQ
jgi:hypothetical protein